MHAERWQQVPCTVHQILYTLEQVELSWAEIPFTGLIRIIWCDVMWRLLENSTTDWDPFVVHGYFTFKHQYYLISFSPLFWLFNSPLCWRDFTVLLAFQFQQPYSILLNLIFGTCGWVVMPSSIWTSTSTSTSNYPATAHTTRTPSHQFIFVSLRNPPNPIISILSDLILSDLIRSYVIAL